MKRTMLIGMLIVVSSLIGSFVFADDPPSLVNHQFYGNVYWDANISAAPTQVDARYLDSTYSSLIKDVNCNDLLCSATYGKAPDNILRVQGSDGVMVLFFLGETQVASVLYVPDKVQVLNLNIATSPVACDANYTCSDWSSCADNETRQNRTCEDVNHCGNSSSWNKTEDRSCSLGGSGSSSSSPASSNSSVSCVDTINPWDCSLWSMCVGGEQRRLCSVKSGCDSASLLVSKPSESQVCTTPGRAYTPPGPGDSTPISSPVVEAESCFDGILNQDERGIDCGGACKPCPPKKEVPPPVPATDNNSLLIFGIAVLAVLVIGLVVFLIIHKKKVAAMGGSGGSDAGESVLTPAIVSQLDAAYAKGEASGMSRSDVTAKLTEKGWDTETLEEYLMSR